MLPCKISDILPFNKVSSQITGLPSFCLSQRYSVHKFLNSIQDVKSSFKHDFLVSVDLVLILQIMLQDVCYVGN